MRNANSIGKQQEYKNRQYYGTCSKEQLTTNNDNNK